MISGENKFKLIMGFLFRTILNMLFILGIFEGFVYSYHFSYKLFMDVPYKPVESEMLDITIEPGNNAIDVAKLLDKFGIVESEYMVLARMYVGKYNTRIQAGTYKLGPSMTPDEICRCICGIQSEEAS